MAQDKPKQTPALKALIPDDLEEAIDMFDDQQAVTLRLLAPEAARAWIDAHGIDHLVQKHFKKWELSTMRGMGIDPRQALALKVEQDRKDAAMAKKMNSMADRINRDRQEKIDRRSRP